MLPFELRPIFPVILFALPAFAEWTLYTCMATTKGYVVGAKLNSSGLARRTGPGNWQQISHSHPFMFAAEADPVDPKSLYVAAGNGLIRIPKRGGPWKILTAEDVTELRDVAVDSQGRIFFGHSAGIRMSSDRGKTWQEVSANLPRKYTEAIRADRSRPGVLIAGGEDGLWRSDNSGASWRRSGASGVSVMRIQQSPHDPCFWLAATERAGVFSSTDCGQTFENLGRVGVDRNTYDIAFDPGDRNRIALAIWGTGVVVSEDSGKTWQVRGRRLPTSEIWAVAFDPAKPGRLFASVHEEAIYVSEDAGVTWTRDGLEGSTVSRLKFLEESAR
ncbi:MAG TPA: hypothetical protein VEX68_28715 [Bryobacteraceae bacterium]|nr:hypothetical protein [Bryobacteraceae bacterium]